MAKIALKQVAAFTNQPFYGNSANVIVHAECLPPETMRKIASEISTLESTFVSPSDSPEASYRIRFFTPNNEYDFSGHAMLATCFALAEEGMVTLNHGLTQLLFETGMGLVPVDYHFNAKPAASPMSPDAVPLVVGGQTIGAIERIMIHRTTNEFRPTNVPSGEIAKILGIPENEIRSTGLPVQIVFGGITNLVVPVQEREALIGMCPDLIKLRLLNRRLGALTTDIFTLEPVHEGCTTYSRHFAPVVGLWEDDASGSGAASIASYLVSHGSVQPGLMIMEQGADLDHLSRVIVEVDDAETGSTSVKFGGLAVTSLNREIELQAEGIAVL